MGNRGKSSEFVGNHRMGGSLVWSPSSWRTPRKKAPSPSSLMTACTTNFSSVVRPTTSALPKCSSTLLHSTISNCKCTPTTSAHSSNKSTATSKKKAPSITKPWNLSSEMSLNKNLRKTKTVTLNNLRCLVLNAECAKAQRSQRISPLCYLW